MKLTDENVTKYDVIITPKLLYKEIQCDNKTKQFVINTRKKIQSIIDGYDNRKIIIVGPCSIHDPNLALEYAKKLSELQEKVKDKFLLIMRVYFEKPRTSIGWKGLISDPHLNGSYNINDGLKIARQLLIDINNLKIGCATEFLEPFTPQFIDDLISYAAIGARTTESPTHRQLASGLSMPVGFKNSTSGDVKIAVNAIKSANSNQAFLGMDEYGSVSNVFTKGNKYAHTILRGGKFPNYKKKDVDDDLEKHKGVCNKLIIDCSHGNSNKDYKNQPEVFENIINQINNDNNNIIGVMIESNINEGNQKIPNDLKEFDSKTLKYGVSITDSCLNWETTKNIIMDAHNKLNI
jgi:3-deoxy-7-phosphoheptulonate synthase